ncbi:AMP-binding protein [Kitasatospora sp. NPDC005748]|uniref:AMP-binding protein n=1 Tax=Kitasatospora sp. NPDC005748 TaxID=3157063 RepID=UPI0033D63B53
MFEGRVPVRRARMSACEQFFGAGMSHDNSTTGVPSDLLDAFTETVGRFPERPAIVRHGRAIGYARLHAAVSDLARRLGPDPGVVAVQAHHIPETVVGLLGILAAGGVYCPTDPAFPAHRSQTMLSAVGCRTMVAADPGSAHRLGLDWIAPAPLPEFSENLGRTARAGVPNSPGTAPDAVPGTAPDALRPPPAEPGRSADAGRNAATGHSDARDGAGTRSGTTGGEPAYLLFTSGSTGQPKPVLTPRRALAAVLPSLRELFGLTPDDRVLQFASLNWDTCFEEILPTLTAGAALVFDDEAHRGSFPRFLRMVERERITVLDLPTAFWHELVLHLAEEGAPLPDCVRVLVIGGEPASPARLSDWTALDTGRIRLVNTYGCTETTLITHAVDLHGPQAPPAGWDWPGGARAPIGRPLPHVVQLISEQGELLIGGPSVALGYHGLPEATGARFTVVDGVRCFRTGDLVSGSPDGLLTHRGRLDGEVKVRGIRVDPAEVEAHIAGHPGVHAVAVAAATLAGRSALVAYVVARADATGGTLDADVLAYLRAEVPGHLVPSRITVVPELVRTTSGKVDRGGSHRRYAAPEQVKGDPR